MTNTPIRQAFLQQAQWCRSLGSPLTALLMDRLAQDLDRSTAVGRRVLDWPGQADARFDALPLRVAGGLHALVRRGTLPALAALYPPNALPDPAALGTALAAALEHPDLLPWLDSAPQTNEVARSAILMAGLMAIAHDHPLPIALLELGSSAGLNLVLDRYAYQLGPVQAGAHTSPVTLAPEWRGPPPPDATVTIASRRGTDLNPLDVRAPADRERLLAYIWADQAARLDRAAAAIALAATDPPPLDRMDAATWLETNLDPCPTPGQTRVVMHSIAFQYFPQPNQARIAAHLAKIGAAATRAAPLAWLRFEVDPRYGTTPTLLLTQWPTGQERRLARGSAHGLWFEWHAEAPAQLTTEHQGARG